MYKRKSKSLAKAAPSVIAEESEEEETIENISKALLTPLADSTNISQDNKKSQDCSKPKKAKKNTKTNQVKPFATQYFEEITEKSGLKINEEGDNHILTCEAINFLRNLKNTLENNVDFPRNVMEFVKGFKNITKEPEQLKIFLILNVKLTSADDVTDQRVIQDSVLKLFLNINSLQEHLLDYILERATEFAIDDKATWVQMLLKPFMFLDHVVADRKLVNGLQDLMDVAGHSTRMEIITCLPDIICNLQHETIVLELSKYLNEDQELTPAILDCLSYLCLPNEIKSQVHAQMLSILRTSSPPNFFPNLVNFFFTGTHMDNELELIRGLRDGLDWTVVGTQSNMDVSSSQVMTVMAIRNAIAKSKNLSTNWLKIINQVKSPEDHKPLDLIILLVSYSTSNAREKIVEGIFRKRIKASLFQCDLLDVTFKKFRPVLREYLKEMLKIARLLLKTKNEPAIVEFASHWFTLLFKELKDSQRTIIRELLVRDYSENDETIVASLNILTKIATDDIASLKPHSLQIFTLVDMLENLTIDGLHHVMDLLCGLAFGVQNSFLEDDVHMLINKQLSSSNLEIKMRGIVGGVMAVKHMVCSGDVEIEDIEENSYSEISNLPDGEAKDAAMIIELISKSTSKFPEMICLFYDELAHVISISTNIDSKFLCWLSSYITTDLTDTFIIDVDENILTTIKGIPISVQLCLNTPDEADGQIALNIAGLCLADMEEGYDLRILPSLFRLTRLVYMKQFKGDLSSIDALLGCGILMPTVNVESGLEDFDPDYTTKILDCYVHCINWFRELINAFCVQDQTYLRNRVIERFNALVCLERNLTDFIKNLHIDYKPPLSSYELNNVKSKPLIIKEKVKKVAKKGSNKKKRKSAELNETSASVLPATLKTQVETVETTPDNSSSDVKCKLNTNLFRVLDLEVLILFQEELVINCTLEGCLTIPNNTFNLNILLLILDELNPKLTAVLPSKTKKRGFFGRQQNTNHFHMKPINVVNKCFGIIPRLFCHMESIAEHIQKSLDDNDGIRDSFGLFTQKNFEAQSSIASLFNMLAVIVSWSGFQSQENIPKLKDCLNIMASRRDPQNSKKSSLKELVTECCIYTLRYKEWCLLVSTAVSIVNFFKALTKIYEDKNILNKLEILALDVLSKTWRDSCGMLEKGLVYNQQLDILLASYFNKPDVEMVKALSAELKAQVPHLAEKNRVLGTFKCIGKSNFPLLFRATYSALYEATKNEIEKGLTDRQHLDLWKNVAITMKEFTEILKIQENRTNLLTFLKKSIPLFRLFLSQGMPMLELKLSSNPDAVVDILKLLQHSTRFLHSLHCHSRIKKDTSFVAYLPQMKLILETLVYKVKAALTANNCSEAFWMGNLKNKNLQGELIASQSLTQTESDADDGEDQLPEDDESISSDLDGDMTDPGSKSVSNIF